MSWKICMIVFTSGLLVSFPQNMIGCGPDADPYDYYTSFFHQNLPDAQGYKPFYYSSYRFLYDEEEPAQVSKILAREWAAYCGVGVTASDVMKFLNKYDRKDLQNLYLNIEKNKSNKIPDTVMRNGMTTYFQKSRDLEALGYILYAKQVEPYVLGAGDEWEAPLRDTAKMNKLAKNGLQLYNAAKKDFFQLKYAYQVVRLALYSGHHQEAIKWYDEYVATNNTPGVLQPLSLALKAGALFRSKQTTEAALLFSKAFSASIAKRVSNYISFKWCTDAKTNRQQYLQLCNTNEEKANMLALFALGSVENELNTMEQVYDMYPGSEVLEVLAVREINKLEEKYFTRALNKEQGGKTFYFYWESRNIDSSISESGKELKSLVSFLHKAAGNKAIKNPALFETAAAYGAFMMKDYAGAKKYLVSAEKMEPGEKLKDQWRLTSLLVTINEKEKIDAAFEETLLPSLQWLKAKALSEPAENIGYFEVNQWKKIYRDLLSEILAKRYHQQGDYHKEALCVGAADMVETATPYDNNYTRGVMFLREKLDKIQVEKLYALLTGNQRSPFENFLIQRNPVTKAAVTEFAGTAYLREYDYVNALRWFNKTADKKALVINTDPFADLLYDQEEPLATEATFKTDKRVFAETMIQLQKSISNDKANAAMHYYKMATGLYNMTYYGHAWKLVAYYRSGSDGYALPKNANRFEKEYYGCFTAHDYFEKALHASNDKNFKARCLFMMAKCSQKQVQRPRYEDYNYEWERLDAAVKTYWPRFKNNTYFPTFVKEYGSTAFYKEAYTSCSYLRDFVEKK